VAKKAHYCPDFLSRVGAFRRRLQINRANGLADGTTVWLQLRWLWGRTAAYGCLEMNRHQKDAYDCE